MTDNGKTASSNGAAWDAMMQDSIADEMARDRARWTAHRLEQANAKVGAYTPIYDDTDKTWTIRYSLGIAAMLTLWGIYEWAVRL